MKIIHPGNNQIIISPRDAVDCIKYSRKALSIKKEMNLPEQTYNPSDFLKLKSARQYPLNGKKTLFLHPEIPTWYILGEDGKETISQLEKGRHFGDDLSLELVSLLDSKSVLEVNGKRKVINELPGRYVVRSDNVSLVSITQGCNMECPHCVANAVFGKVSGEMNSQQIMKVLRDLGERENPYQLDVERKVFISGGEPFLRNDLEMIVKEASNNGLSTHINTNSLRITDEFLKNLKGHNISFVISLDGEKENHEIIRGQNTYERTLNNIRKVRSYGFDVFLNNFLHEGNLSEIEGITDFAASNGVLGVNFIPAIPRGRGQGMEFKRVPDKILYRALYDLMKKDAKYHQMIDNENLFPNLTAAVVAGIKSFNCGLSKEDYFFLDSKGNVFPCPGMRFDEFIVGNVLKEDLGTILKRRDDSYLNKLSVDNFPICSKCDFRYHCGGDCRGSAYINSGKDLTAPIKYCNARIESLIEIFNILGEDPNFMLKKSKAYISNSIEEREVSNAR